MAFNPLYSIEKLPTTSAAAIVEFNDRYLLSYDNAKPYLWVDDLGEMIPTNSPITTFPITQIRTSFLQAQGPQRFKDMQEMSVTIKAQEFRAGYEAPLKDLFNNVYAYARWSQVPAEFVDAEARLRCKSVAALLEAGTSTVGFDGVNFFSTSHPTSLFGEVSGTWSNYQSSTKSVLSVDNIAAEIALGQTAVVDALGDQIMVQYDTIVVPVGKYELLKNLLGQQFIPNSGGTATQNNPYYNGLRVVPGLYLTDTDDWYLVDSNLLKSLPAWISFKENVPPSLALRSFDESSDFFKNTNRIKMSAHVWYGFGLAFPHAIRRVAGA